MRNIELARQLLVPTTLPKSNVVETASNLSWYALRMKQANNTGRVKSEMYPIILEVLMLESVSAKKGGDWFVSIYLYCPSSFFLYVY